MNGLQKLKIIWHCRKELLLDYKTKVDFIAFQKEWRERNPNNFTIAGCKFDPAKVEIGEYTYGTLNIHCWDNPNEHINIGNYCSIAENVHFLLGGMHPTCKITTYPYKGKVMKMPNDNPTLTNGPIIVEDDVWICYGATILSGVTIGKGSIIAAKSVVAKDVPPYSIVINGEIKRRRFSDEVVQKLQEVDLRKIREINDLQVVNSILDIDVTDRNVSKILSEIQ